MTDHRQEHRLRKTLCLCVHMYLGVFCFSGFPDWPGGRGGGGAGRVGIRRPEGFDGRLQNTNINDLLTAVEEAILAVLI